MKIVPIKETIKSILGFAPYTPQFIYDAQQAVVQKQNESMANSGLNLELDLLAWGIGSYVKKEGRAIDEHSIIRR